jgi:hypothetical protein
MSYVIGSMSSSSIDSVWAPTFDMKVFLNFNTFIWTSSLFIKRESQPWVRGWHESMNVYAALRWYDWQYQITCH